ncbi:MAG: GDYXXLXY domain-containing protein [Hellea sp.]
MTILRYALIALGGLAIASLFGSQIKALETIKTEGSTVLLDLRPVDPRALMMGDFMALRYAEETPTALPKDVPPNGQFVLSLDENRVGTFNRLSDGSELAANEIKINYIRRKRGVTFGAPRYYFQNGTAETYEQGDYGIFKISPSGRAILVGLADEKFEEIQPPAK